MKNAASARRKQGTCHWCNRAGDVSDDHIPPKTLFPRALHSSMVVVDACDECNQKHGLDDEYFRDVLVGGPLEGVTDPQLLEVRGRLERAHARRKLIGRRSTPLKQTFYRWEADARGILKLQRYGIVDMDRICWTVCRIVAGLYPRLLWCKLRRSYHIQSSYIDNESPYRARALDLLRRHRSYTLGHEALAVTYIFNASDKHQSEWLINFYGSAVFFAVTSPNNLVRRSTLLAGWMARVEGGSKLPAPGTKIVW